MKIEAFGPNYWKINHCCHNYCRVLEPCIDTIRVMGHYSQHYKRFYCSTASTEQCSPSTAAAYKVTEMLGQFLSAVYNFIRCECFIVWNLCRCTYRPVL